MAKSKGKKKKVPPASKRRGMTRKEFEEWLKEKPEKKKRSGLFKKKKKKKSEPFPYWFFMAPPELYPDPVYRPPGGWPADKIQKYSEPQSPWLGTPSLNEHLAHPQDEPLREA